MRVTYQITAEVEINDGVAAPDPEAIKGKLNGLFMFQSHLLGKGTTVDRSTLDVQRVDEKPQG